MPRSTIGPFKTEAEAADAAYRATRAAAEPHTITGLGPSADAVAAWLVVRGRIRECWLEKKLAAPPTIAWPLFWISPASGKTEGAEKPTELHMPLRPWASHQPSDASPGLIVTASPEETPTVSRASGASPGWPVPADETPRGKGKKG